MGVHEWVENNRLFVDVCALISRLRPDLLSVGIRLNVQVNLVLRSCVTFSSAARLDREWGQYQLGCFGLTEVARGVISGLHVALHFTETEKGQYMLRTSDDTSCKQYISQALTSERVYLVASNTCDSKDIRIFSVSTSTPGIQIESMPPPVLVTGLDLGRISIVSDILLPPDACMEGTIQANRFDILDGIMYGRVTIGISAVFAGSADSLAYPSLDRTRARHRASTDSLRPC